MQAGHQSHDFLFLDIFLIKKNIKCVSLNGSDAVEYYAAMKTEPHESAIQ